jgi:hypothetical protein
VTRQVTANMLTALKAGRQWKEKSTSTHIGENGMLVRLHENLIAILEPRQVRISAAGWATATTCDRLHAIASAFCGARVNRRNGKILVTVNDQTTTHHADAWITLPRTN